MERPSDARTAAPRRFYGRAHGRWRKLVLQASPICVVCLAQGKTTAATIAHHVVEVLDDPDRRLDPDNGVGVCAACHNGLHKGTLTLPST